MYGAEWQPCYACGVRSRPEEQTSRGAGGQVMYACKDTVRCARFAMEMQGIGERRGPVQPPPVPQTGAAKRRRAKRSTRSR